LDDLPAEGVKLPEAPYGSPSRHYCNLSRVKRRSGVRQLTCRTGVPQTLVGDRTSCGASLPVILCLNVSHQNVGVPHQSADMWPCHGRKAPHQSECRLQARAFKKRVESRVTQADRRLPFQGGYPGGIHAAKKRVS